MVPDLDIRRLRDDSDWAAARPAMESLQARAAPSPWMRWDAQKSLWRLLGDGTPCWWVEWRDGGANGVMLLRESRRPGIQRLASRLRTQDWGAMAMPALLAPAGEEERALAALPGVGRALSRATGIGVASLHKLHDEGAAQLVAALREARVPLASRTFNQRWRIELPDDLDAYLARHRAKAWYNIRRSARLLGGDAGLRLCEVSPPASSGEAFDAAWREFEELRRQWPANVGEHPGPAAIEEHHRALARAWWEAGIAELLLLRAGERLVAAQLNVRVAGELWVVLMAYDASLAASSPGRVMMLHFLEHAHARGDRVVDLGGEGDSWKEFWATGTEPTRTITWPLGGLGGACWRARHLVRGGRQ